MYIYIYIYIHLFILPGSLKTIENYHLAPQPPNPFMHLQIDWVFSPHRCSGCDTS